MAWSAVTGDSYQDGTTIVTVVVLNDGKQDYKERFRTNGSQSMLEAVVQSWIAQRDASTSALKCVAPGTPLAVTPSAPPAPRSPTPEEQARAAWLTAYRKVTGLLRGVAAGVSAVSTKNVADAQAALNALPYDPSYEEML